MNKKHGKKKIPPPLTETEVTIIGTALQLTAPELCKKLFKRLLYLETRP